MLCKYAFVLCVLLNLMKCGSISPLRRCMRSAVFSIFFQTTSTKSTLHKMDIQLRLFSSSPIAIFFWCVFGDYYTDPTLLRECNLRFSVALCIF